MRRWLRSRPVHCIGTLGSSQAIQSGTGFCQVRSSQPKWATPETCPSCPWVTAIHTEAVRLGLSPVIILVYTSYVCACRLAHVFLHV